MKQLSTNEFKDSLLSSIYGKEYFSIIENAIQENRGLKKEKGYELHHIQPKALGGNIKSKENLIKLTTFEHCVVHLLLCKALPCLETLTCIILLSGKQIKTLNEIEQISLEKIYELSTIRENALRIGHPCSEETKQKVSKANKGKKYAKGLKRSPECRHKISELKKKEYAAKKGTFSKNTIDKRVQSSIKWQIETYGKAGGQFHKKEIYEKSKNTRLERYGDPYLFILDKENREKGNKTKLEKYGSKAGKLNNKEIIEKKNSNRRRKMTITRLPLFKEWYNPLKYNRCVLNAINDFLEYTNTKLEDYEEYGITER